MFKNIIKKKNRKQELKELKQFSKDLEKVICNFKKYFSYIENAQWNTKISYCTLKNLSGIHKEFKIKIEELQGKGEKR